MKDGFRKIAVRVSAWTGSAWAFGVAIIVISIWAISGPAAHFSNTWQLLINTGTTIGTFLMVFLIQNTQNREAKATQLKLDELIRASKSAHDSFIDLEDISDDELEQIADRFKLLHVQPQQASPGMHKLHQKIVAEHARRRGPIGAASHAVGNMFNPHSSDQDKK